MGEIEKLERRVPVNSANYEKFPYIRSPLYGEIPAPRNLAMLLRYLESVRARRLRLEGWRGQANIGWKLDSTAARRLHLHVDDLLNVLDELPDGTSEYGQSFEKQVRNYEARLLNQARMSGHGFHGGRELTDLELLSVLRHYGAATRLMDFSRNVIVALWFACTDKDNRDEYGLLVGIEGNVARRIQTEADLKTPVPELIDVLAPDEQYWLWEPRHLFQRMRVQQSLFVFGPAIQWPWGSAPFGLYSTGEGQYKEAGNPMLIAISPSLKADMEDPEMKDYAWRDLFGYDARTLFPDIEGFSRYHSEPQGFESSFFIV